MDGRQEKLLQAAQSLIGIPYKYAAKPEDIPKFLDCSSFAQYAYKQIGIEIPRSTLLQAAHSGKEIKITADLKIGDLLFFRGTKGHYDDELFQRRKIYIGHVVMCAGKNKVIHGSSRQGKIMEENLDEILKKFGEIVMIKRIL